MNILTTTLKRYTSVSLMLRIFIGLVIGAILGLALPGWTGVGILGRIFVSALKGIAPVLVAVLVISSIAKAGRGMGRRFTSLVSIYLLFNYNKQLTMLSESAIKHMDSAYVPKINSGFATAIVTIVSSAELGICFPWIIKRKMRTEICARRSTHFAIAVHLLKK